MSYTLIKNAKVISERKILKRDILIKGSVIADADFSGEPPPDCIEIDAMKNYLSPGFVDIHVHGGGGFDFMDCTQEAFCSISKTHLKAGTTTLIPTAVSAEFEDILQMISAYKAYSPCCPNFYGIHLEGPFISKKQKGAHKAELLHSPTDWEIQSLLSQGNGVIKRITAAPELEGVSYLAKKMTENGVVMSLGHSDATAQTALASFKKGFTHITHLYCATPSIRKINQVITGGILEAAYLEDNVTAELIADGKHVAPEALQLALKIKGIEKIALTTDALRPAGTTVTESWLGEKIPENRIIIEDGVAKLPDRSSFAGSIATCSMLLEKGVYHYALPLADVIFMLTQTPAEIMHIPNKGKIQKGYDADFVFLDANLKTQMVMCMGKLIN